MELKDLKIGNWIGVFGKYREVKGFSTNILDDKNIEIKVCFSSVKISKTEKKSIANPEEINPIELSPEIMKSIGFKRHVEHYTLNIDGYVVKWINMPQFSYPLTISHQCKDDFLHLHNIRYVHELQNIIKCFINQELNIDLCKVQKHSKIQ